MRPMVDVDEQRGAEILGCDAGGFRCAGSSRARGAARMGRGRQPAAGFMMWPLVAIVLALALQTACSQQGGACFAAGEKCRHHNDCCSDDCSVWTNTCNAADSCTEAFQSCKTDDDCCSHTCTEAGTCRIGYC